MMQWNILQVKHTLRCGTDYGLWIIQVYGICGLRGFCGLNVLRKRIVGALILMSPVLYRYMCIQILHTYIGHRHFPLSYHLSRTWNICPNRCFEQECYTSDPGLHFTDSLPKQMLWSAYPQAVVPPGWGGHNAVKSSRSCESCITIVMRSPSKQVGMEKLSGLGMWEYGPSKVDYVYWLYV